MENVKFDKEKLLSDKRVVAEIQRHLWIESEKAGRDIGFEKAKEDWLKRFALDWLKYHMPEELTRVQAGSQTAAKASQKPKTRRAKSYL